MFSVRTALVPVSVLAMAASLPLVSQRAVAPQRPQLKPQDCSVTSHLCVATATVAVAYSGDTEFGTGLSTGYAGTVPLLLTTAFTTEGNYAAEFVPGAGLMEIAPLTAAQTPYTGQEKMVSYIIGDGGLLYYPALLGGNGDQGAIIRVDPSTGTATEAYAFGASQTDGAEPTALIRGSDGLYYGVAEAGGKSFGGSIFSFDATSGAFATVAQTCPPTSTTTNSISCLKQPVGLVQASDGNYYGVAQAGGAGYGGIFRYSPATQAYSIAYAFTNGADGETPGSAPVEAADGNLYGTSTNSSAQTIIWQFNLQTQSLAVVYTTSGEFTMNGPFYPGSDGNLYGAGYDPSDASSGGMLFSFTPGGSSIVDLHDFASGDATGTIPLANLIQTADGTFYGSTVNGGTGSLGALYSATIAGIPSPITVTPTATSVTAGNTVILNYSVRNAFSATMQQCYAFAQNTGTGAVMSIGPLSGTLSGGVWSGSVSSLAPAAGTYDVSVVCGGGQDAAGFVLSVSQPVATATQLVTSSVVSGQQGSLTVDVTAADSSTVNFGSVTAVCAGYSFGPAAVNSGVATLTLPDTAGLPQGSYACKFTYSPAAQYGASSVKANISLTNQGTTTKLSNAGSSYDVGSTVTLTATVTGANYAPNGGYVTFSSDGSTLGVGQVKNGSASITVSVPDVSAGPYTVKAVYSGTNAGSAGSSGTAQYLVTTPGGAGFTRR